MSAEEKIKELEAKIALYESNGMAKLYYSLNRKMNEMADMMNSTNLKNLTLEDKKDGTFERLKSVWTDAEKIANAAKTLGEMAGITGDEKKDVDKKPFIETIAMRRD